MSPPSDSQIHELLVSIRPERTRDQRLHVLDQLILYWLGHCPDSERYTDAELGDFVLPYPMKRLFSVLGKRRWRSDTLVNLRSPENQTIEDDERTTIATENQDVWELRTEPVGKDPNVYTNMIDCYTFERLPEPLSEVLLEFVLIGLITTAPACRRNWETPANAVNALLSHFERIELTPFMAPIYPYEFFTRPGAFAAVYRGTAYPDSHEAFVAAKSVENLAFLDAIQGVVWEEW